MSFRTLLKSVKNTGNKLPRIMLCAIAFFITNWCTAQDISVYVCPVQRPTFNAPGGATVPWYGDDGESFKTTASSFTPTGAGDTATIYGAPSYKFLKDGKMYKATAYVVNVPTAGISALDGSCFNSPSHLQLIPLLT